MALDNAFFFEFADLGRQTAAVDFEIVGKCLAVVGNIKAVFARLSCFLGKIGHDLIARGALGNDFYLLMEKDGFVCEVLHHIEDQLLVKAAVVRAGMKDMTALDQHNFTRLVCYHRNGECCHFGAGKSFGKYVRFFHVREDASIAVVVDLHDLYRSRKHDTDVAGRGAFGEDGVFFIKAFDSCTKAGEHGEKALFGDAPEERAVL